MTHTSFFRGLLCPEVTANRRRSGGVLTERGEPSGAGLGRKQTNERWSWVSGAGPAGGARSPSTCSSTQLILLRTWYPEPFLSGPGAQGTRHGSTLSHTYGIISWANLVNKMESHYGFYFYLYYLFIWLRGILDAESSVVAC